MWVGLIQSVASFKEKDQGVLRQWEVDFDSILLIDSSCSINCSLVLSLLTFLAHSGFASPQSRVIP
jgi:hypothetical protein